MIRLYVEVFRGLCLFANVYLGLDLSVFLEVVGGVMLRKLKLGNFFFVFVLLVLFYELLGEKNFMDKI